MTSKEYLSQAHQIESRISAKAEQIEMLRSLVMKVSSAISDTRVKSSPPPSKMEEIVVKIMDLEEELKEDMGRLIAIKRTVMGTVRCVQDPELQLLLEKRYLCYEKWEDIAVEMGISVQHMFRLHGEALKKIDEIRKMRVNERE